MSQSIQMQNPGQRILPGMIAQQQQQQQPVYHQQQVHPQAQVVAQQTPVQQSQTTSNVDLEQKKLQDMIEAINLIGNIRDDMNSILDNIGKSNSSNNYSSILANKQNIKQGSDANLNQSAQTQQISETEQANQNEVNEKFYSLDSEEQEFFEKTDTKYMTDKVLNLNKSLGKLDEIIRDLQPIQFFNLPDYNSILLDQTSDERTTVSSNKFINNCRYFFKLQETLNNTNLTTYKRFSQNYSEKKSLKYKTYSCKPLKKEELEKLASTVLANPEIRVVSAQKSDHQFVLDIIMPQNFKFVFLLFDSNVEKFQVRPLDSRILKMYTNNKLSDEICYFDFEHKNKSNVFQRLEENCLFACIFFKTEYGPNYFNHILKWIKSYKDLFNAKCSRCEKHLLNGIPPTWRDLKSCDPYHDECRVF